MRQAQPNRAHLLLVELEKRVKAKGGVYWGCGGGTRGLLGSLGLCRGGFLVEINPEPTPLTPLAHLSLRMGAVEGMEA